MVKIKSFTFNPFMENTYILYDHTAECIIIDPGCLEKQEQQTLLNFIELNKLKVKLLLNTHCHIDHVLGNKFVKEQFQVKLQTSKIEEQVLKAVSVYAPNYGFHQYQETNIDQYIEEGHKIKFGNTTLDILFVPGHSPGHLVFYNKEENICIGGDVLFNRSIGRTDLPGGDHETLITNIHQKMFKLDNNMVVYPGHGEATTIGDEKKYNPFCAIQ
jgi:hydroxyacylglutathione hydrolase